MQIYNRWPMLMIPVCGIGVIAAGSGIALRPSSAQIATDRPDLVVKAGETKQISARTYTIANLTVEAGGTLQVMPNQAQWLVLDVAGDARIDGRIEYRRMRSVPGPITATAPDGTALSFDYPAPATGGDGGDGGQCGGWGGAGARGTVAYGGGGGGGGWNGAYGDAHLHNGDPATDYRGAARYNRGGNGAQRAVAGNGGLIYLAVTGTFSGSGAIDLAGLNGDNGGAGDPGRNPRGAGGGGGGAPGGDGGYLRVKAGHLANEMQFTATGGIGGKGGGIGGPECLGTRGGDGQNGGAGYADFLESDKPMTRVKIKRLR